MGLRISRLVGNLFGRNVQTRIIMLGLDDAGKTTILYRLGNVRYPIRPTRFYNFETLSPVNGVTFTVLDMGGQDSSRAFWREYCNNCEGLLYVVDSTDLQRMEEARVELLNMLDNENMRDVPVVILANKQDTLGAMTAAEVTKHLYLNQLTGRDWCVQQTCGTTGQGLLKAMSQMAELTKEFKKSKR